MQKSNKCDSSYRESGISSSESRNQDGEWYENFLCCISEFHGKYGILNLEIFSILEFHIFIIISFDSFLLRDTVNLI